MDQRNFSSGYDTLLDLVKARASVRKLKPDAIPDEDVTQVLEVGRPGRRRRRSTTTRSSQ
jgi:hypothetical protein